MIELLTQPHPKRIRRRIWRLQVMRDRLLKMVAKLEAEEIKDHHKINTIKAEKLAIEWVLDVLGEPHERPRKQEVSC